MEYDILNSTYKYDCENFLLAVSSLLSIVS